MKAFIFSTLLLLTVQVSAQEVMPDHFPAGKKGLEELASYLLTASWEERIRLTYALLPTKEEYHAVFQKKKIKKMQKFHKRWYRKVSPAIGPRFDNQIQILIEVASSDSLFKQTPQTANWPGGYREMQAWLLPDLQMYRLTYTESGKRVGTTFDFFIYLNGRWRVFPKPYLALVG